MEDLESALFLDQVPVIWSARAYPSLLGLSAWFADLLLRLRGLEIWSTDFVVSSPDCQPHLSLPETSLEDQVHCTVNQC